MHTNIAKTQKRQKQNQTKSLIDRELFKKATKTNLKQRLYHEVM